jgi:hypothetical protein
VSRGPEPHLTSLPRWAPALPRVPRPQTSPPCQGGFWRCHVSRGPSPCLLAEMSSSAATCPLALDLAFLPRWAPALPRVPWLRALSPQGESSSATTCPMALGGLWTTGIKKGLATLGMQQDLHVSMVHSRFTEVFARRADMRHHHYL